MIACMVNKIKLEYCRTTIITLTAMIEDLEGINDTYLSNIDECVSLLTSAKQLLEVEVKKWQ